MIRPPRSLLPALLLALLFAGSTVTGAQQAGPIRIGASISRTGRYAEPAGMIEHGYRLWAAQVNERGGLLGRPVELTILDDGSSPERAAEIYRSLSREADLVLSPYGTPLTLAVAEVTEAAGLPLIASASASALPWSLGYQGVFGVYAQSERYFIGLLDLVARRGLQTVATIKERSAFNVDVVRGIDDWAPTFGLRRTVDLGFPPGEPDVELLVDQLVAADSDVVVISTYPEDAYRLLREMARREYRPAALAVTIAPVHPSFYATLGPYAEGIFGPSQWEPDERIPFPGTAEFVRAFVEHYGIAPSYHAGSAYAACEVLQRAVESTGSLDPAGLRTAISRMDTVTVIGRFKTDERGMQVGHNPILIQWQDGEKEIVYPHSMATSEARLGER